MSVGAAYFRVPLNIESRFRPSLSLRHGNIVVGYPPERSQVLINSIRPVYQDSCVATMAMHWAMHGADGEVHQYVLVGTFIPSLSHRGQRFRRGQVALLGSGTFAEFPLPLLPHDRSAPAP